MPKFRKKPVVIEAWLFDGTYESTEPYRSESRCRWFLEPRPCLEIPTMEGVMTGEVGDWIIRGIKGEFYPCKPDIFEATYEPVSE